MLLTTLVLLIVGSLAGHASTGRTLSMGRALLWGLALVAGGASFGSGLGLAIAFPIAAWLALPRVQRPRRTLAVLTLAGASTLALYALARSHAPDFDPRVWELTSPLTALRLLPEVLAMTAQLLGFGAYALGVGAVVPDIPPNGWLMASAAAGALALAAAGWIAADPPMRRLHPALWLLLVAVYATTAAGRVGVVEALGSPLLRAALWTRYHYLALALLGLALAAALGAIRGRGAGTRGAVSGAAGVWSALRLLLLALHPVPIDLHPGARAEIAAALADIHRTVAEAPPGDVVRIPNRPFGALTIPLQLPGLAGLFMIHFPDGMVDGRPVRFVVSANDWTRIQSRGGRIAALVEPC